MEAGSNGRPGSRSRTAHRVPGIIVPLLSLAVAVGLTAVVAGPSPSRAQYLASEVELCRQAPENRIGGAAIGDCLAARSRELDDDIAQLLSDALSKLCADEDRADLRRAQLAWSESRERQCGLILRSPGNTASFVNAAACTLVQGFQRIDQLDFFNAYATPSC